MRTFQILFVAASFIVIGCTGGRKIRLPERPKLAVYWTSPVMSENEADSLARFHLVIADMDNLANNPKSLKRLKRRNRDLILLCYSNPMEFWDRPYKDRPIQNQARAEVLADRQEYLLKQPSGKSATFWNNMQMLNLSVNCPAVKGQKYYEYMAEFLLKNVLSDPIWDGYFMDNCTGHIAWVGDYGGNNGIDADNDGHRDDYDTLDRAWYEGTVNFLSHIKQENFLILGNKGAVEFLELVNGKMFEEFPNDYLGDKKAGGWYQCLKNYDSIGSYSVIHARQIPNNPKHRLFVLSSALMGDGYYAYAQDFFRWFPEYEDIGKPLQKVKILDNVFERQYEKATVRVWPEDRRGEIVYK
ncbi:hypothetical protein GF382_03765 [Candidatus Falkowbacteria bacterium]|nr:hypothetical protein [Candidatus Falkowbacteria bacterium]